MGPLLHEPAVRRGFLASVVVLLLAAMALVGIGWVEVKMLPFDNKAEFQVIVDMPEGTPLEETLQVTRRLADRVLDDPEVVDVQLYVGAAAPYKLQRAGAALLPAWRAARGRHPGQPHTQGRSRPAEPRCRSTHA